MPEKTHVDLWRKIVAMGEKVCEECPDVCPRPGSFEEKRDALGSFLWSGGGGDGDPDATLEYVSEHFTPRDLWPAKIDAALEAAHQAGERGDPLEGLDLGLG